MEIARRMTKQRLIILEELRKTNDHPTAEELYNVVKKRIPHISLGTVYRNLDFLSDTGVIRKLESGLASKRFDGDMSIHNHVHCVYCGKIGDVKQSVEAPIMEDISVDGFSSILNQRVEYDGICKECAKRQAMA